MNKTFILKWRDGSTEEIQGDSVLSAIRENRISLIEIEERGLMAYIEKDTGREHVFGFSRRWSQA